MCLLETRLLGLRFFNSFHRDAVPLRMFKVIAPAETV